MVQVENLLSKRQNYEGEHQLDEFGKVEAASLVDIAPQFSASRTGDINENSSSSPVKRSSSRGLRRGVSGSYEHDQTRL